MSITQRQEQILGLLNDRSFITVQELSQLTFTSASSIRRDLTYLQNNGLVKRLHGGVSAVSPVTNVASFYDRTHKNVKEKRLIAQKAAALLKDGQTVLLDSSTTATFLLPYIAKHHNMTVFTNNLSTALHAIELGIRTHCLGGHAVNGSTALAGTETFTALSQLMADILFFSSQSLDGAGCISDRTEEENYVRKLMLGAAKTRVFLCDGEKFDTHSTYTLCRLDDIEYAVFDVAYPGLQTSCQVQVAGGRVSVE